ncbi:hypothetical protein WJX73_004144 [Symbiochloris irregularis]|uniref:Secreted protein n=1 Tax=Symbiochloris irregularis TaxID=706552 RepID=A0AAW1NNK8_9CHLO
MAVGGALVAGLILAMVVYFACSRTRPRPRSPVGHVQVVQQGGPLVPLRGVQDPFSERLSQIAAVPAEAAEHARAIHNATLAAQRAQAGPAGVQPTVPVYTIDVYPQVDNQAAGDEVVPLSHEGPVQLDHSHVPACVLGSHESGQPTPHTNMSPAAAASPSTSGSEASPSKRRIRLLKLGEWLQKRHYKDEGPSW